MVAAEVDGAGEDAVVLKVEEVVVELEAVVGGGAAAGEADGDEASGDASDDLEEVVEDGDGALERGDELEDLEDGGVVEAHAVSLVEVGPGGVDLVDGDVVDLDDDGHVHKLLVLVLLGAVLHAEGGVKQGEAALERVGVGVGGRGHDRCALGASGVGSAHIRRRTAVLGIGSSDHQRHNGKQQKSSTGFHSLSFFFSYLSQTNTRRSFGK